MRYTKYHAVGAVSCEVILDGKNIRIDIWERGAGYTPASGSSSTAAAAVAYKIGFCGSNVIVHMPGGNISVSFLPDFTATIEGPVVRVCSGIIDEELFINETFEPVTVSDGKGWRAFSEKPQQSGFPSARR